MPVSENWKKLLSKGLVTAECTVSNHPPTPSSSLELSPKCVPKPHEDPIIARIIEKAVALTACSNGNTEISDLDEMISTEKADENIEEKDEDDDIFDAISDGKFLPTSTNLPTSFHFPTDEARPSTVLAWFDSLNRRPKFVGKLDQVGKFIGIDCEMVGVGQGGRTSALARISIINYHGQVLFDQYIRPTQRIVDYRTKYSGITPMHMKKAVPFAQVRQKVKDLLSKRTLVGHDLRHDLKVLRHFHSKSLFRDTSRYPAFTDHMNQRPSLKDLAQKLLGLSIQQNSHDSIEDARVAMLLYRLHKHEWENYLQCEIANTSLSKQLATPVSTPKLQTVVPLSVSTPIMPLKFGFIRKRKAKKRKALQV